MATKHNSLKPSQFLKHSNHSLRTCFPVNPWQITRVFLSIQTLAVDDMDRTLGREIADTTFDASLREFMVIFLDA